MEKNKLKWLRERTGLNMKDFSRMLGINYLTYTQWEYGRRKPAGFVIGLIERVLKAEGRFKEDKEGDLSVKRAD